MAWTAEDTFNSYSDGDLNGQNGGTGWTGAWSGNTLYDVQGTTVYEGSKAVKISVTAGSQVITRPFTGISAGLVYISVRRSTNSGNGIYIELREGSSNRMFVRFGTDGNISVFNGGSYDAIQAYSANTWYRIGIEFNDATQPDQYRVNVDNGAFSGWKSTNGAFSTIDAIRFDTDDSTAVDAYFDAISPNYTISTGSTSNSKNLLLLGVG